MSQDHRDSEMEQRLSEDLARLADRAVASPDALQRILRAGSYGDPASRVARPRAARLLAPALAMAAAVLVALAIVVPKINGDHGGGRRVQTATPPHPAITKVSGPQRAAWVTGGTLYVGADGSSPITVGTGSTPQWSPDGKWLAYLVFPSAKPARPFEIRMVRQDGTHDHLVLSAAGIAGFMWSPSADVIAAVPLTASDNSAGIVLVGIGGSSRYVLGASTQVDSIMWSQDGLELAYSGPQGVFTVPAAGGTTTRVPYSPPTGAVVVLAGWWPSDRGLLLWADPPGAKEANGLALTAVSLDGTTQEVLGTTLVFLRWLTWSPDGTRLAFVTGGGPSPTLGKSIRLCRSPAGSGSAGSGSAGSGSAGSGSAGSGSAGSWSCRTLPQPAGTVSIDPAWSPNGAKLAFVRADAAPTTGPYDNFFGSRTLYVAGANGAGASPLPIQAPSGATRAAVGTGVVLPAWSPDGAEIGYSTGAGVVVVPATGGPAQILDSGLVGSSSDSYLSSIGTDYYGKAPWDGAATWISGPGSAAAGGS